jgi:hypothetical protein
VTLSCAGGIPFESILRHCGKQKCFHTAKIHSVYAVCAEWRKRAVFRSLNLWLSASSLNC